jgi:hypothetical protein
VEAYHSPRPRRKRRAVVEEDYAVSPTVEEFPQLRRRNALHRSENYELSPTTPFETLVQYQEVPRETGLLSWLTNWISNLG